MKGSLCFWLFKARDLEEVGGPLKINGFAHGVIPDVDGGFRSVSARAKKWPP